MSAKVKLPYVLEDESAFPEASAKVDSEMTTGMILQTLTDISRAKS